MKLSDPKIAIPIVIIAVIAIVVCIVTQRQKTVTGMTSPEDAMKMPIPGATPPPAPIPDTAGPQAPQ